MGTDFYSINKVILAGHAFPLTYLSKDREKKTHYIRVQTKEVFIYGKNKRPKPSSYYHLIKTTGSLAEFCAKYIVSGDLILVEGRLRNFPSSTDKTVWRSVVMADRVITLTRKDDLRQKVKIAIDKK